MDNAEKEPTPTIWAELKRRRLTVGRLAAATGLSEKVIRGRLNDPDSLKLGEVVRIATALDVQPGDLLEGWASEVLR